MYTLMHPMNPNTPLEGTAGSIGIDIKTPDTFPIKQCSFSSRIFHCHRLVFVDDFPIQTSIYLEFPS